MTWHCLHARSIWRMLRAVCDEHGILLIADEVVTTPASRYTDPAYFELEKQKIFRRLPLIVAASCEIREAGSHTTLDIAGVPVLVVRGRDGVARAFLNVCTHRGAILAKGADTSMRLSCPYHGWVFDDKGALVGVPCRKEFGEIDAPNLGLKEFPVRERGGLIWAILDPESTLDIDGFLGDYGAMLEQFGFESWHMLDRRAMKGANWKLAFDAHLDFYHLPVLHRNSFGADVSPQAHYYHYGPHQRLARPACRPRARFFIRRQSFPRSVTQRAVFKTSSVRFQVLRRDHRTRHRTGPDRHRRPEWLRQVQPRRSAALGDGRKLL